MRFKKTDLYIIGGIVAAVWMFTLATANRTESKNFRPIEAQAELPPRDEHQHFTFNFQDTGELIDSKSVVQAQRVISVPVTSGLRRELPTEIRPQVPPAKRQIRAEHFARQAVMSEQFTERTTGSISNQVSKPVPQQVAPPTPEPISRPLPQPSTESISHRISEPVPQQFAPPTSKPISQPLPQPTTESISQTISGSVPEQVAPPTSEPISRPLPQPTTESISQTISGSAPELIAPPVPEPISRPLPQLTTEPKTESISQQISGSAPELIAPPTPEPISRPLPQLTTQEPTTQPEPVVHGQNITPAPNLHRQAQRYDLTTETQPQVPTIKSLRSGEELTTTEYLKNKYPENRWQKNSFAREVENQVRDSSPVLSKNTPPATDQNTDQSNSNFGDQIDDQKDSILEDEAHADFYIGKASTSEYSFDSSIGSANTIQSKNDFATQTETDRDLARNSSMVRKVNWERIEPDLKLAAPPTQTSHFPVLAKRISLPETEIRALNATKQGKALATRGAYFAAREEFMNALMIVAQSNDRESGNRAYTTSLLAGFTALKESDDFATTVQRREHSRNLKLVVASHETKAIQPNQFDSLSFNKASEAYCQFAQARIEQAIGESKAASSALFHLSRILSTAPGLRGDPGVLGDNSKRAILLASLTADPKNYEAANELGVLFYKEAWYKPAAHWFSMAVEYSGGRQVFWQNLAAAHSRLAETTQIAEERSENIRLAQISRREAATAPKLESSETALAGWVSPEQFRENSAIPATSFNRQVPVSTAQVQPVQATTNQKRNLSKRIKDWFQ